MADDPTARAEQLVYELDVERVGNSEVLIHAACACGESAIFDSGQAGEGYVRPDEHLPHYVLGDWIAGHAYCEDTPTSVGSPGRPA